MHRQTLLALSLRDTIVAPATADGEAAIAVVRLSGPDSLAIADQVVPGARRPPSQRPGGTFFHARLSFPPQAPSPDEPAGIDDAILLIFRAPHSYTREDTVEFHCHGGRQTTTRLLRALTMAGARLAGPGEFTRRAFLNGRLDLTQAEAVMDLIRASSERAATMALEQLHGGLSRDLNRISEALITVCAHLEALLDFPDDDIPDVPWITFKAGLQKAMSNLEALLATWGEGHLLRDGARVVIAGLPNSGKSSLMNSLLSRDRAIVSHFPGTTRDTIEETLLVRGIPLRLVDTAGLRHTDCAIEREGVARARSALDGADIVLYVVDGSSLTTDEDIAELSRLRDPILVINKADLPTCVDEARFPSSVARVSVSCLHQRGVQDLLAAIHAHLLMKFGGLEAKHAQRAAISERHRIDLETTKHHLVLALDLMSPEKTDAFVEICHHLRQALDSIDGLTGQSYSEDLLDRIFGSFCIGK